jgi:cytidyltransferase-like protein
MASFEQTVLCVGCYDPFHWGHLCHFTQARSYGDKLVVAVTRDPFVNKGPNRPVFNVFARAAVVRALAIVDDVIHCNSSLDALQQVKPHFFALGKEYQRKVRREDTDFCKANGIEIVFTNGPVHSSTKLLELLANEP